jgi:hypothetical protein
MIKRETVPRSRIQRQQTPRRLALTYCCFKIGTSYYLAEGEKLSLNLGARQPQFRGKE